MIHILTGPFGCGKTELAINLALRFKRAGEKVTLLDLDVITPYFRIRDVVEELGSTGVDVITVRRELKYMDLPIVPQQVMEAFAEDKRHVVVDLGGDDDGARVISSLRYLLERRQVRTYFVVNVFRPFNETAEEIVQNIERLSQRSRLKFDALVNNTNMGGQSTEEDVKRGEEVVAKASEMTGLPVKWTVLSEELADRVDTSTFRYPVLVIKRFMRVPWEDRR